MQCPQNNKASTGSELSPGTPTCRGLNANLPGNGGNWNSPQADSSTGSSWSPSPRKVLWPSSKDSSDQLDTGSWLSQGQPANTAGKKTPVSPELNSSLDPVPSASPQNLTGMTSGQLLKLALSTESRHLSRFDVMAPSEESLQTLRNQLEWSELVMFSGVQLVLASQGELGKKLDYKLILKTREQSGGVGILIMNTLLLMNFEVQSISHTYSDGLTDTQSWWKLKGGLKF